MTAPHACQPPPAQQAGDEWTCPECGAVWEYVMVALDRRDPHEAAISEVWIDDEEPPNQVQA